MKNLIPHFVQDNFQKGKTHGWVQAYTMFVDMSGFTPLTESLMREGNRGAEQLSLVLNEIFGPLVSLVYAKGGFIPYFAGDAFTAIFPTRDTAITTDTVIQAAFLARNLLEGRKLKHTDFPIGIKIGISWGRVEWGVTGHKKKAYYFRGEPIDHCAACQQQARNLEIVVDEAFRELVPSSFLLEELSEGFYRLDSDLEVRSIQISPRKMEEVDRDTALQFLPAAVVNYRHQGEFRPVISAFISFEGVETHELLDEFAGVVLDKMDSFSGYFKEIDFGDKGGVIVGIFGAPVSFENNVQRALEFILTIREELWEMQQRSALKFRIGLTYGMAYTGIIGGEERCQYAAVGNRVNLAARLMTSANWGEVLVDSEIGKSPLFTFQEKGDIKYKGIKGNIPTYKFIGRNYENRAVYNGQMVGRDREIHQLSDFAHRVFADKRAGIAFIYGEAGIGKSRLTHELRGHLQQEQSIGWHVCPSDQILKKPFNPFLYFLRSYFELSPDHPTAQNREKFLERIGYLEEEIQGVEDEEANKVTRELARTRPILAALAGVPMKNSIWDQLDAKGRYQNTLQAISNLILAEALIRPLVLELEDGHWMDDNSKELLQELVRRIASRPVFLLITSRYLDDGAKPRIFNHFAPEVSELPQMEIDLHALTTHAIRDLAQSKLDGPVTEEFMEMLVRTSNSNPFYLEQILDYFSEGNLLEIEDGAWNIRDKNVKVSGSINAILTARIDRLSNLVRETVKAAAVIGREFEVPVLSAVMREQEDFLRQSNGDMLREQIQIAERGQIWHAMSELRYIFKHSLLREAAYGMQLRTRLQQLHKLIAEAIERLYADNIEERYVDLAFHYDQAEVFSKTCEYLRKAADYARRNYQNQQALDYYEKLLQKLTNQKDSDHQIHTLLNKGRVLELIGEWEDCQAAYAEALVLAKNLRDVLLLGRANNSLGHLLMLKGNYPEAKQHLQTAAQLFESIDDKPGIAKVYGNLGNLHFRQGQYAEAKSFFEKSIDIGQHLGKNIINAQIVANLGLTHMNQGDYDEGIRCQEAQLAICEQNNDKQGMATLYTNLGIVLIEKGDYDEALKRLEQGLQLSEELGNKLLTSIATGCIGTVYERKGDYDKAMANFEYDLELVEELGDKQGIAIALGLIGELLSYRGEFHRAIEYLQKNLMLCEELGYQKGIAKAVNTLGDVFYYTKQYDRSLYYYNRAIEVTRRIKNKLVLGFSLVEKAHVLLAMENLPELEPVQRESLELAEELGNPDLLFEAKVVAAKTKHLQEHPKEAMAILLELLSYSLNKFQEAAVCFEISKILPKEERYKQRARQLYESLYAETPKYLFKMRLRQLEEME